MNPLSQEGDNGIVERSGKRGLVDKIAATKHRPTITVYAVWDRQLGSYVLVDGLLVRLQRGTWERHLGVDHEIHSMLICPEGVK
jgi:hypothetical protein